MNSHNPPSSRANDPFVDGSGEDSHQLLGNAHHNNDQSSSAPDPYDPSSRPNHHTSTNDYQSAEEDLSDATPVNPLDFTSPAAPPPVIPHWTPDSPSAAHPNLPAPPTFDALPSSRARAWSNDSASSATAPLNSSNSNSNYQSHFAADPSTATDLSSAGPRAGRPSVENYRPYHHNGYAPASGRPGTSDGASVSSPPTKKKGWRSKPRGFFVLGSRDGAEDRNVAPGYLEAGRPTSRGKDGKVIASEDLAARRRRQQKIKLAALAGGLGLLFLLLIGLAVGVGIGAVHA